MENSYAVRHIPTVHTAGGPIYWLAGKGMRAGLVVITWLATLLYLVIIAPIKCAILLEWVDIFVPKGERNYFTYASWATCFAFVSLSVIIFVLDLVNCTPFESNWDPLVPGRVCKFQIAQFGFASSTTNFVLDLIPIFLAQKVIWGLRLPAHKKWGVSIIFLVGLAGCAASLVRLYYSTRFYVSNDTSYYFSILAITSLAETTAANLVLCAPFIPKAAFGLKQSRAATAIRSYRASKSEETYTNSTSDAYLELREPRRAPAAKSREHWFTSSKVLSTGTTTTTAVKTSHESNGPLRQPETA
ncbi:putative 60S ribosomal protein l36 protein [Rosellinia necatrix]|uniref:Putative 60S ribosomal protein l36 protein n=1 Tax=Rosellinia necatrix TaxID=77044 RepID=A0A1W2TVC0_ROSNE|nr:putative 60S ribosomal protein l36 protein [Rosellinia necatrix]